jgi:mono/diheme cytochrome c family protein
MLRKTIAGGAFIAGLTVALVAGAPGEARAQDAKKGQQVYDAQKCSMCHAIAGKGAKASPLDGVGAKLSADQIRLWIVDPVAAAKAASSTKKPPMPAKYSALPAGDIDSLVAYMQTLK